MSRCRCCTCRACTRYMRSRECAPPRRTCPRLFGGAAPASRAARAARSCPCSFRQGLRLQPTRRPATPAARCSPLGPWRCTTVRHQSAGGVGARGALYRRSGESSACRARLGNGEVGGTVSWPSAALRQGTPQHPRGGAHWPIRPSSADDAVVNHEKIDIGGGQARWAPELQLSGPFH